METLKNIKELIVDGKYKYSGFVIMKEPIIEGDPQKGDSEIVEEGSIFLFFKDIISNDMFFVKNTDIYDYSKDAPYGIFQKFVSSFTANYDVEKIGDKFNIYDKDAPKVEVITESENESRQALRKLGNDNENPSDNG